MAQSIVEVFAVRASFTGHWTEWTKTPVVAYGVALKVAPDSADEFWTAYAHPVTFATKAAAERFAAKVRANLGRVNLENWAA